jgi:hypothetical protein
VVCRSKLVKASDTTADVYEIGCWVKRKPPTDSDTPVIYLHHGTLRVVEGLVKLDLMLEKVASRKASEPHMSQQKDQEEAILARLTTLLDKYEERSLDDNLVRHEALLKDMSRIAKNNSRWRKIGHPTRTKRGRSASPHPRHPQVTR